MQAKYVMNQNGEFIIANESLGMPHPQLSGWYLDGSRETSAGFVYLDADTNRFVVYGRSTGLALASDPFAADAMNEAFRDGKLFMSPTDEDGIDFLVSNRRLDGAEIVSDLAVLREKRVVGE